MYSSVKTCVKGCNSFTDYADCVVGLKQGYVLSPVLLSLLLEDLEPFLQDGPLCALSIDELLLVIVLFADDMMIFLGNSQFPSMSVCQMRISINLIIALVQNVSWHVN